MFKLLKIGKYISVLCKVFKTKKEYRRWIFKHYQLVSKGKYIINETYKGLYAIRIEYLEDPRVRIITGYVPCHSDNSKKSFYQMFLEHIIQKPIGVKKRCFYSGDVLVSTYHSNRLLSIDLTSNTILNYFYNSDNFKRYLKNESIFASSFLIPPSYLINENNNLIVQLLVNSEIKNINRTINNISNCLISHIKIPSYFF